MAQSSSPSTLIPASPRAYCKKTGIYRPMAKLKSAWYRLPFRWHILSAIAAASVLTWLVAGLLAVLDSRTRATVETRANMDLWQRYISAKAENSSPEWGSAGLYEQLGRDLQQFRHVSAMIRDVEGNQVFTTSHTVEQSGPADGAASEAPRWFVWLVEPQPEAREFPLWAGSRLLATVRLIAKPDDEIAEAWELLRQLSLLWLSGSALMMIGLYFVLGRLLNPLVAFADGMRELEDGHYSFRVEAPRMRELGPIAHNFNMLASALETARDENVKLNRQLIDVQEDERRQIAADLHDEFGPCLFGIGVSTAAIQRLARTAPEQWADDIIRPANEIATINEHMKGLNRALLARLRPAALGRVSVEELLSSLVSSFEQRHPDVEIEQNIKLLPKRLGDAVELTLYRCIQEGLTNALRHGGATRIRIDLGLEAANAAARQSAGLPAGLQRVSLSINDNGKGLAGSVPPGLGLSSMRERVRALAGSLDVVPGNPGTCLLVSLPVEIA